MFFAAAVLVTVPFLVLFFNIKKKASINSYAEKIKKAKENLENNVEFTPFIDANKVQWYILELIPGISRIDAKRVYNFAKHKENFKDFKQFANFVSLELPFINLAEKILKF